MYFPQFMPVSMGDDQELDARYDHALAALLEKQASWDSRRGALVPVPVHDRAYADRIRAAYAGCGQVAEDIGLIVSTSGTTGIPKGALLGYEAIRASAVASAKYMGSAGRWLLALPGYHIAGINVVYRSLLAGYAPKRMNIRHGFSVEQFITLAQSLPTDVPRFTSLVPSQIQRIIASPAALAALKLFDGVLIGGAATPMQVQQLLHQAEVKAFYSYGMSETCGGCVYNGHLLAGVTIDLFADERIGESCQGGRIAIKGNMIAQGYYNFPRHEAFAIAGTFLSNDIGRWTPRGHQQFHSLGGVHASGQQLGQLEVEGRMDDIVNISGIKINPHLVTHTLAQVCHEHESVIIALPNNHTGHMLVAVLESTDATIHNPLLSTTESAESAETRITRYAHYLYDMLGLYAQPRYWVLVDQFPRIGPGKIDKNTLATIVKAQIAAGNYHKRVPIRT